MSESLPEALSSARYYALATFRRDGREVITPVWGVVLEGRLYAYTLDKSGKVKRIRATGRVRAAPSTMRGKVLGDWREGTGRVVAERHLEARVYRALGSKYGVIYYLLTIASRLGRNYEHRVVLELTL